MKGCHIFFIEHNSPIGEQSIFIQGESYSVIEDKLRKELEKNGLKNNETLSYFNWMNIDSDFSDNHNHDAVLSVYYRDNEIGFEHIERSLSYKINFDFVNIII